ncbi:MAG TPA: hypothetical protein VGG28_05350 [Kofleriaceae bacterium]|jgi:hypothetical protein
MANQGVVDAFLDEEDRAEREAPFVGYIERGDASDDVRVTPWSKSGGCPCSASLQIPKSSIVKIERTDDKHFCCGKEHSIVRITFVNEQAGILKRVFAQTMASANTNSSDPGCEQGCAILFQQCIADPQGRNCYAKNQNCMKGCQKID